MLASIAGSVFYLRTYAMANLSVRNLNKSAYKQLQIRAAKHGVSMEEEARRIIYQAVCVPLRMSTVFKKYFGDKNGIDLILHHRKPHEPTDFDE